MNKSKVIFIVSGFGGGIEAFVKNTVSHLDQKLVFDVITFNEAPDDFREIIEQSGGKISKISNPLKSSFVNFFKELKTVLEKEDRTTFIHSNMNGYRILPFYLVLKRLGFKNFGVHAHTTGLPSEINSPINRVRRFINRTFTSHQLSCGREASLYLFGKKPVENKEIMHIPNSIDENRYLHATALSEITNEEILRIGHMGRFEEVKNHDFMLEIIKDLKEKGINFKWYFIGDGRLFTETKEKFKDLIQSGEVVFLGRRSDVPDVLKSLDWLVLPSLYEGFPTTAIETQAAGVPILMSDTITTEVDLGMDLVNYLPITDPKLWTEALLNHQPKEILNLNSRIEKIRENKMTNETSVQLYFDFIQGKLTHYEL